MGRSILQIILNLNLKIRIVIYIKKKEEINFINKFVL